jgi:YbbR domain-containing protein
MMRLKMKKQSLKFISLFLSLFLWAYVLNSEKIKFEKVVLLDYILPDEMVFSHNPAREVIFLIEGPRAFSRSVTHKQDRLVIDLNRSNLKSSPSFYVDINPTDLNLPFGMRVDRIKPWRIPIRMEKRVSKKVPVRPQFIEHEFSRPGLAHWQLSPSEVEIQGPRAVVSAVSELFTRPIEVDSLIGEGPMAVELSLPDERLSMVKKIGFTLDYRLKVASSDMILRDLPVKFRAPSKKLPKNARALATLRLLVSEKLQKDQTKLSSSVEVWAHIPDYASGKTEIPLTVNLPPGIDLLEISPKSIIVNIE